MRLFNKCPCGRKFFVPFSYGGGYCSRCIKELDKKYNTTPPHAHKCPDCGVIWHHKSMGCVIEYDKYPCEKCFWDNHVITMHSTPEGAMRDKRQ